MKLHMVPSACSPRSIEISSPGIQDHNYRIAALDRTIVQAMEAAAKVLNQALDDISIECDKFPRDPEIIHREEHRSFYCKLFFARIVALHLSSKLTPDQMLWWTR